MKRKRRYISTISIIIIFTFVIIFTLLKNKSLANDISFTSKNFNIGDNIITNISPNTDVSLFGKYFDTINCHITITNENNEPLTTGFIYTGSKTNLYDATNNLINTYTNIITGDVNYDGIVDIKDIEELAIYLIEENNLEDYQKKAIDINKDNEVKINDLTLLESYLKSSYETLTFNDDEIILMSDEQERLVPTISPNIILNQNLTWTSSNEDAITVDETGKITAHNEGESIITATTKDGTRSNTKRIVVDNTPRLSEQEINVYSGPKETIIGIKALDYQELSCASSDESIVKCQIINNQLIVKPESWVYGNAKITVTSPTYGTAELTVNITYTSLNVLPHYACIKQNESRSLGPISPLNAGTISVNGIYKVIGTDPNDDNYRIPDREIVTNVFLYPNSYNILPGLKTGLVEIDFMESNGNNISIVTVNVYKLSLANTSGTTTIGNNLTTTITAENAGELSCRSSNDEKATCQIENNQLIVTPISSGTATITVNGNTCGGVDYNVTINDTSPEPNEGGGE